MPVITPIGSWEPSSSTAAPTQVVKRTCIWYNSSRPMHLFAGSSHPALAHALARELNIDLGKLTLKRFSSGECYVKFDESVRGNNVYIIQGPGREPDAHLVETFLMCQAAKLSFASSIHVIIPHFSYSRQDRIAAPREPISAKLI